MRISVDGLDLGQCFTTWENYYRTAPEQAPPPNRNTPATINSLQFRSSVQGPPALAGGGYLFDNVRITPSDGPGPPGCDVPIEKEADQSTVRAGGRVGYRITVRNRGRLAARNLRACDRIPRQMTFVSADRKLRRIGRQRCLVIPRLRPGQRASFHLVLQVSANAPQVTLSERRRHHAASGRRSAPGDGAGVAGRPGGPPAVLAKPKPIARAMATVRILERVKARAAEVHRITAIAAPLGSERRSLCSAGYASAVLVGPGPPFAGTGTLSPWPASTSTSRDPRSASSSSGIRRIVRSFVPTRRRHQLRVPTFKHRGKYLIYFAAFKDHLSVYCDGRSGRGAEGTKGHVSASSEDDPVPEEVVRAIVAHGSR